MESGPSTAPPYVAGPLTLTPFRAFSLTPRRVGDPASARAFARPYRGVPHRLAVWLRRGLASRDATPAIYLHEYSESGLTIRGLVGCIDVSHHATSVADCQIFPHEGVHPQQVDELAARMDEMRINPAPILLVHHGPAAIRELVGQLRETDPQREYVDHAGQEHRVWAITDPQQQDTIAAALADARLLVADGHHRYAAYVSLESRTSSKANRRGLAMIIDHEDTALFLGAIHRILHGVRISDLLSSAEAAGATITRIAGDDAVSELRADTLVLTDGREWATVQLDVPPGQAAVQLVDDVLISRLPRPPQKVAFAHSLQQAMDQVRPGQVTAALLPAVDLDVVLSVVRSGGLLPEKATSFQPKPNLGSFIRLLDE
ncbi:DUF1015 family protein [Nocardioides cynanchi]|uniref:DUF1015 family protein n=1 Tax=Nocardioides cynanchi TaxID=2558918 RepID=UPI0012466FC6|nr:DUF1015 family protein [Nocardioides cynanchi]